MKTAICYYSRHHGNTQKVLEAMARAGKIDLMDVSQTQDVRLEGYDCVGFASGIYFGKFHKSVLETARRRLPAGKAVFFVCTYGMHRSGYTKDIRAIAQERGCTVLGEFGCRGYDTFGPFRLVGGIAKGHPSPEDLEKARAFARSICPE